MMLFFFAISFLVKKIKKQLNEKYIITTFEVIVN